MLFSSICYANAQNISGYPHSPPCPCRALYSCCGLDDERVAGAAESLPSIADTDFRWALPFCPAFQDGDSSNVLYISLFVRAIVLCITFFVPCLIVHTSSTCSTWRVISSHQRLSFRRLRSLSILFRLIAAAFYSLIDISHNTRSSDLTSLSA